MKRIITSSKVYFIAWCSLLLVRPESLLLLLLPQVYQVSSLALRHTQNGSHTKPVQPTEQTPIQPQTGLHQNHKSFGLAIIGGGASGMFAAAAAKDFFSEQTSKNHQQLDRIQVFESSRKTMTKVSISGGGRCNVMHDSTKALPILLESYPRGSRELNGLMTKRFGPNQIRDWFEKRGVELKTESDGRMFPITDSSETVVECVRNACYEGGGRDVVVRTKEKVLGVVWDGNHFVVKLTALDNNNDIDAEREEKFNSIILATGSSPGGYQLALSLGHELVPPVPSLFTLNAAKRQVQEEGGVLYGLSGLTVRMVDVTLKVSVPGKKKKRTITQSGPLLITHGGISGPATLKLSAFAAREFHSLQYKTEVSIHWAPEFGSMANIESSLWDMTSSCPNRRVASFCPLQNEKEDDDDNSPVIPRRLWSALVLESGIGKDIVWAETSKKQVTALACSISKFVLEVNGRGIFKDEFVTAGGINLREISMKTMESKKCPGLFFCGEIIDVDGVTGGFNFMNCWSTGYVAGRNAADKIISRSQGN